MLVWSIAIATALTLAGTVQR